jgi:hypothetical protein
MVREFSCCGVLGSLVHLPLSSTSGFHPPVVMMPQGLGAVQGDVALGVHGGTKDLKIDGRIRELRLRRRGGGNPKNQQGQTDRGLSGMHIFLRRERAGRSLRSSCLPSACIYISAGIDGKAN